MSYWRRGGVSKLWRTVKFGNGEMLDLGELRAQIRTYTQALTLYLNPLLVGSLDKIEARMDSHDCDLKDMKESLH